MVILAYGVEQPTNGDRGNVFFPALEHLCQRMATHSHNGTDSAPVKGAFVEEGTIDVPAASWTLISAGLYSQNLALPTDFQVGTSLFEVRDAVTGETVYPKIIPIDATNVTIYSNDNAQHWTVYLK